MPGRADMPCTPTKVAGADGQRQRQRVRGHNRRAESTGRAIVVGETSCGCLRYLGFTPRLPGGGELAYSEVGFTSVKVERIEGKGACCPTWPSNARWRTLQQSSDHTLGRRKRHCRPRNSQQLSCEKARPVMGSRR